MLGYGSTQQSEPMQFRIDAYSDEEDDDLLEMKGFPYNRGSRLPTFELGTYGGLVDGVGPKTNAKRRAFALYLGGTLLVLSVMLVLGFTISVASVDHKSPASIQRLESGPGGALLAGAPLESRNAAWQPVKLESKDGLLAHRLVVETGRVSFPKLELAFNARTFGGSAPGPTFVVRAGETLKLVVENRLGVTSSGALHAHSTMNALRHPNETNIHAHGLHISPKPGADNIFKRISPGSNATFEYALPDTHPAGTFWLHAHWHGSSALQTAFAMHSALVVLPPANQHEVEPFEDDLVALVEYIDIGSGKRTDLIEVSRLSGSELELGLKLPSIANDAKVGASINFIAVNGRRNPEMNVLAGALYRLRIVNTVIDGSLYLSFDKACDVAEIAADGVAFSKPRPLSAADGSSRGALVPPGSRRDISVRCSGDAQVRSELLLETPYAEAVRDYMGQDSKIATGDVLRISVHSGPQRAHSASAATDVAATAQQSLGYPAEPLDDLRKQPVAEKAVLAYTQGGPNTPKEIRDGNQYTFLGFNGKLYSDEVPIKVKLNQVLEWTIVGSLAMDGTVAKESHPFHLHTNHFQVVDVSSQAGESFAPDFQIGDFRDTIAVPAPGNVTIRWVPRDFTGKTVLHCHTVVHADTGMQMNLEIIP